MEIKTDDESNGLAGSRSRLDRARYCHLDHQSIRQIIQIYVTKYIRIAKYQSINQTNNTNTNSIICNKIHTFCEIQPQKQIKIRKQINGKWTNFVVLKNTR